MSREHEGNELDSRPQSRREWSGWLRSLVLPLAVVVAIVGGSLYFQNRGGGGTASDGYGSVDLPADRNPTGKAPAPAEGSAAPDFLLQTLDGRELRLSDLQGKPLLVNFWATWCAPCRQETPTLVQTYLDNQKAGLMLLAVDVREAPERAKAFADEFTLPYPVLLDRSGEVSRTWRIGGPTEGLPASYFVDSKGVVQKIVYGSLTDKNLREGLQSILGPGS
jgi:peroxiredoxin